MTALLWLLGSLFGFGRGVCAGLFLDSRRAYAGDVIAADLRGLRQMRSPLQR